MDNLTITIRIEKPNDFGIVTIYNHDNYYSATLSLEKIIKILKTIEDKSMR